MKFKDFQAPVLFSSTFKALNLGEKIQALSRMHGNPASCVKYLGFSHHTGKKLTVKTDFMKQIFHSM